MQKVPINLLGGRGATQLHLRRTLNVHQCSVISAWCSPPCGLLEFLRLQSQCPGHVSQHPEVYITESGGRRARVRIIHPERSTVPDFSPLYCTFSSTNTNILYSGPQNPWYKASTWVIYRCVDWHQWWSSAILNVNTNLAWGREQSGKSLHQFPNSFNHSIQNIQVYKIHIWKE